MLKKLLNRIKTDPVSEPIVLQKEIGKSLIADLKAIGNGDYVLPANLLLVTILAPKPEQKSVINAAFGNGRLEVFLSKLLREEKCRQTVTMSFNLINKPKRSWSPEQFFEIVYRGANKSLATPTVAIVILKGKATKKTYKLRQETINLGRGAEAYDKYGTLIRKNDVIFNDITEEPNNYVSKIHAQIKYEVNDKAFYLSDNGFEYGLVTNGTRLFRQGNLIAKLEADQEIQLQKGDEIHLGKASVRFDMAG